MTKHSKGRPEERIVVDDARSVLDKLLGKVPKADKRAVEKKEDPRAESPSSSSRNGEQ
jgi:hypothetical protein